MIHCENKEGPVDCFRAGEVTKALEKMNLTKLHVCLGQLQKCCKLQKKLRVGWYTESCNGIVKEGRVLEHWKSSLLESVYKGKGDTWFVDHTEA